MVPFRIFDRESKQTWIVLNFHPDDNGGEYLAAREDDSQEDGNIELLSSETVVGCRMVGFVEADA